MVHHTTCPVCKSGDIVHNLRCRDHFLSGEYFELYKCSSCGFIFTQDHPGEENSGKYYESDEYASHNTNKSISGLLYRVSRKIMLRKKLKLIRKTTGLNTGKLLDIGSGSGHFLSGMKNAGWEILGIEINDKTRYQSAAKFGLEVMKPEMISSLKPESFDCITLWHVLEHFQDPFSYVREIRRLLKPEGICIAAMPNCMSYDAMHYGSFWAAYDVPRHLWHFNSETFGRFSLKAGLKMIELHTLPLDVFYISLLSEKYKGTSMYIVQGLLRSLWFSFLSLFYRNRTSSLIFILGK